MDLGHPTRLHWFIPDGTRADPDTFDVFRWAAEGRLPNVAALMARGSYGYSIPVFPTHTPVNFATLLTGAYPEVHGVADGPIRVSGQPLANPSVSGFSSSARKIPAIWSTLEATRRSVFLMSLPGSTPPELQYGGITVRGRWGGWGADFSSLIFETESASRRESLGRQAKLFLQKEELTRFVAPMPASGFKDLPKSWSPPAAFDLSANGMALYGVALDGTDDGVVNADRIAFVLDPDGAPFAVLAEGEWTAWAPTTLRWQDADVPSNVRIEVIRVEGADFIRVRVLVDALNRFITEPPEVADELRADVGPMVDYADSFPAQLVHYPEDKAAFIDEANQSLRWHSKAVDAIYSRYHPDVFIHSIYTPNQMLTSRWWMGSIDPTAAQYAKVAEADRKVLWDEVFAMYRGLDDILGRAMANADENTVVVFSSDHGVAPMNRVVRLNNLFASRGWLQTKLDPATGAPVVDWSGTKVVFLNMDAIYIHPDGLGGAWVRASGPAYEALRDEVAAALEALRDGDGAPAVASVVRWESAATMRLPTDRVGDLIVANHPGFGWSEEATRDGLVFDTPLATGYKQGILPGATKAVWTPFIIAGPGIKAGYRIPEPIQSVDQLPTILTAMGVAVPDQVQGQVLREVLK
ncbi:MAG: hypothetical protein EXR69_11930 [Myxococcales bacterium]|nr:hypothetical protein [Myxococcales bacterium]